MLDADENSGPAVREQNFQGAGLTAEGVLQLVFQSPGPAWGSRAAGLPPLREAEKRQPEQTAGSSKAWPFCC